MAASRHGHTVGVPRQCRGCPRMTCERCTSDARPRSSAVATPPSPPVPVTGFEALPTLRRAPRTTSDDTTGACGRLDRAQGLRSACIARSVVPPDLDHGGRGIPQDRVLDRHRREPALAPRRILRRRRRSASAWWAARETAPGPISRENSGPRSWRRPPHRPLWQAHTPPHRRKGALEDRGVMPSGHKEPPRSSSPPCALPCHNLRAG